MKYLLPLIIFFLLSGCGKKTVVSSEGEANYYSNKKHLFIDAPSTNTLYMGIENPILIKNISYTDKKQAALKANDASIKIKNIGDGSFTVTPINKVYNAELTITVGGYNATQKFTVEPLPVPVAKIGKHAFGNIKAGEIKAQQGIRAVYENFPIEVKCSIKSYKLTRISSEGKQEQVMNHGASFSDEANKLIAKASAEDVYLFEEVKYQCPDSPHHKPTQPIVLRVK